jgi:DNA-binding response OmpR family regulator
MRAHVLIAEDNPRIAGMIAAALRNEGYRITVAYDGESALRLAICGEFDALLTDLHMPGLNGDVVATRARMHHADLPVLLMTAATDMQAANKVPWAAVIRKPFRIAMLVETVTRTLTSA